MPAILAAACGMALWFLASAVSGAREAWDASFYWWVAYPLALAASAAFGRFFPRRCWLWVLVLFESQLLAMFIRAGEVGNLWPLGMALLAVLAAPGIAIARFVARRWPRNSVRPA